MPLYEVSYDLNRPGQNYADLIKFLESYGENALHLLKSSWLIFTSESAEALYERLRPMIDTSDHVLVARIMRPYSGWLPKHYWEWIAARIDK